MNMQERRSTMFRTAVSITISGRMQECVHPSLAIVPGNMLSINLLAMAALAAASWSGNINYRSPSLLHKGLGISMPKVVKRQADSSYMSASVLSFTHGVASGDPYSDSVILWTRASPIVDNDKSNITVEGTVPLYNHDTKTYVRMSENPVCVSWQVATDDSLGDVVSSGRAYTSSDIDYTVKVEAKGLQPFTEYYYQFAICDSDKTSPVGRTKTAPRHDDDITGVNVAVYSCSNFPNGFFNVNISPCSHCFCKS